MIIFITFYDRLKFSQIYQHLKFALNENPRATFPNWEETSCKKLKQNNNKINA